VKYSELYFGSIPVESILFWCGFVLCVAIINIVLIVGMVSWITGLVIPFVATSSMFVGMRLKGNLRITK
jgi:hypothetical protein